MFTRLFIFLSIIIGCNSVCRCQNLDSLISKHKSSGGGEKIYIHYAKTKYILGDTLWFKAYLFNGAERSNNSKNFYFELFDEKGTLLNRFTGPVLESTASGSIIIPQDRDLTALYCRAYTPEMLKNDTGFIYSKKLSLIKPNISEPQSINPLKIGFFPEGGDWMDDIPTLMAFKVTDVNGMPAYVTGYIKSNNKIVTEFSTAHDGMGIITILPQTGEEYIAVWKDLNGKEFITVLPPRKLQGIVLHVATVKDGKKFFIFRTKQASVENSKLLLVASINNSIVYEAKIDLTKQEGINGLIPVKDLPSGILQITVYNKVLSPIAERITFVDNDNYLFNVDTQFRLVNKQKRGLNKASIQISNQLRTNLSLSVTDAEWEDQDSYQDNIISHLLLTGDLRGKILNPYYYFSNKSDSLKKHLDLVMLTHGWRKYNWDMPTTSQPTETLKGNNFISIDGKLGGSNYSNKFLDTTVNIILQTSNSSSVLLPLKVNKSGEFFKDGLIFYGNANLYFKFTDKRLTSEKVQISVTNDLIDSLHIPPFNAPVEPFNIFSKNMASFFKNQDDSAYKKNIKLLKEVVIVAKNETQIQKVEKQYTTGIFSGGISTNFLVGDDPKALNNFSVFQYLQHKIAGLEITDPLSESPAVLWRGIPVKFFLNNNETAIPDIRSIGIGEFDYIKVYDPSMGGIFGAYGGVIAIYTKKGKGYNFVNNNKNAITLTGYTPVKEFYSPDYATYQKSDIPDQRMTLFWNPNIILDKNNKEYNFQFYNNDLTKKFKVVLEGVNSDGKIIHIEKVL